MDAGTMLHELEPVVEQLLERHISSAKEWYPHEWVPWGLGRDFEPGEAWEPGEHAPPPAVRSALVVNLLTEDNLPYYFRTIERIFGRDGAWGEWSRRWTAEEGRHAIVIRDYLTVTRAVDPVVLEQGRMAQVARGETPEPESPLDGLAYVALQELATRISHRNTGALLDEAGFNVMKRVAGDENRHHLFYRDLVSAALERDPSLMVEAISRQVRGFAMPGTGIPGFSEHAKAIARAGIYDFAVHHDQILEPVISRHWRIAELEGLSADAERAREQLLTYVARVNKAARRRERVNASA